MKIIKNIEEPTVKFESLKVGDVFLLAKNEKVCMKVPKAYYEFSGADIEGLLEGCMDADDFYYHEINAYDLENNEFFWLDEDDEIRPLNAYMEVK